MLESLFTSKEIKDMETIRDILISSDAVRCDVESYEPMLSESNVLMFKIPSEHRVQVNYNKMAVALYIAGYRKKDFLND